MKFSRRRRIKKGKQNIHINSTNSKVRPGELKNNKKSDFENRIVIEELGSYLGEGAHGSVHTAKIYQQGGGVVSYAVKKPSEYFSYDKRIEIVNTWYKRIEEMRKIGIKNVVDYAEIIDDKLFLTDLRIYGNVLDFEKNMELSVVDNFEEILYGIARDMGKIHSNNFILSDNGGTYGFRAWFLLKSKTREGFIGERVICDVGGIEDSPPNFKYKGDQSKENFNKLMSEYMYLNLISLMAITSFNEYLSYNIVLEYLDSCKEQKKINSEVITMGEKTLFYLQTDLTVLRANYISVFSEF